MRKNMCGFHSHLQGLVNCLVREEFPALGRVQISSYVSPEAKNDAAAHWYECESYDGGIYRCIMFNLEADWSRLDYLRADDEDLRSIIRHELVHGEMRRQGLPSGDCDSAFILECLKRKIRVNDDSIPAFENVHGRGSFALFQQFLPPAEVETIPLAEGGGVWVREKYS
jgi:hypothetical protein